MEASHKKRYVITFACVLLIFFIVCIVKHTRLESERTQMHKASVWLEFPVESYIKFRPFIEQVLIPRYEQDMAAATARSLKRTLKKTPCAAHLFSLLEHSKLFAKAKDDGSFSSIKEDLANLHTSHCTNSIVQSMSAGFPKFTIALLMLAPFGSEYFEEIRFGFKWNPEFLNDSLIKFLAALRLSIIAPVLLSFSKFVHHHDSSDFDHNVLSLPPLVTFDDQPLLSLVAPGWTDPYATVHLDPPKSVVNLTYDFERTLRHEISATGRIVSLYILKIKWHPGRYILALSQSMKLHGKSGKWYHLRGAYIMLDGETALLIYDSTVRIWTLYRRNGKVQTVPSYFAVRFIQRYATEVCYSIN